MLCAVPVAGAAPPVTPEAEGPIKEGSEKLGGKSGVWGFCAAGETGLKAFVAAALEEP
jgi:hypothetical protein